VQTGEGGEIEGEMVPGEYYASGAMGIIIRYVAVLLSGFNIVFCGYAQKIGVFGARSSMNWKNWGRVLERFDFLNRKFGGFGYKFVS
jgi:hypothetical protein